MNYDFSEKEQDFIQAVADCIQPFADKAGPRSRELATDEQDLRQVLSALAATGYTGVGCGGTEIGMQTLTAAQEHVAAAAPSLFLSLEMSCRVFGRSVATWVPTRELRDTILPLIQAGRGIGAVALSEDSMNTENQPLETKGHREDQLVLVNGTKSFVINGPLADWIAVAGQFEGQAALFVIPRDTSGLTLGERFTTSGYEGSAICMLTLENCRVPATHVITPAKPDELLPTLRLWENQVMIGASLGALKSAFETARDSAKTHRTGGKPAIAYQAVAFKLSEMLTLYQTAQLLAYRAAWTCEEHPREAESLTWCAKVFCTEAAEKVAGYALQILSSEGFLAGHPAERAYRNAKLGQIYGTSTEIARVKIGDQALGYK